MLRLHYSRISPQFLLGTASGTSSDSISILLKSIRHLTELSAHQNRIFRRVLYKIPVECHPPRIRFSYRSCAPPRYSPSHPEEVFPSCVLHNSVQAPAQFTGSPLSACFFLHCDPLRSPPHLPHGTQAEYPRICPAFSAAQTDCFCCTVSITLFSLHGSEKNLLLHLRNCRRIFHFQLSYYNLLLSHAERVPALPEKHADNPDDAPLLFQIFPAL